MAKEERRPHDGRFIHVGQSGATRFQRLIRSRLTIEAFLDRVHQSFLEQLRILVVVEPVAVDAMRFVGPETDERQTCLHRFGRAEQEPFEESGEVAQVESVEELVGRGLENQTETLVERHGSDD